MKRWARLAVIFAAFVSFDLHATNPSDVLTKAFDQMKAGNCSELPEILEPLLKGNGPYRESAYRLLSDCYAKTKQLQKAAEVLREGIKNAPPSPILERSLGELLFHQDVESIEAGELLRQAAESLPNDPESRHFYAQWAYLNNREQICVEQEKQALKMVDKNNLALLQMHTLKALCEDKLDEVHAANDDFRQSNSLNSAQIPFDPATAYQYAEFLLRHEKGAEAQNILRNILIKSPQFAPAHLERAKHLDRQGRHVEAIQEAQRALAGEGMDANGTRAAHVLLAKLYFATGKTQEADEEQHWVIAHSSKQ